MQTSKKEFWENHIALYRESGYSQKAYCREQNISYWSFNSWKRKLEKEKDRDKIIEIPLAKVQSLTSEFKSFEIFLTEKITIRIPDNFNPETLKRIIQTVRPKK